MKIVVRMSIILLSTVITTMMVSIGHAAAQQSSNYVVQIRPSNDNTFWIGDFSKYFPDGSNVSNFFDNKSGADDFNLACLSGDTIVVSADVTSSDLNPPMITINVVFNGNTIHSNTAVGDYKPAVLKWSCGK